MDRLWWREGDSGGQAWPRAQNVSHAIGKRAKYQKQRRSLAGWIR
jgi:hypothetical protein